MSIIPASEKAAGKLEVATLDVDCLAVDESIGQLFPGGLQYSVECGPGNPHLLGALLLLQSFQVSEPNGLEFLKRKANILQGTCPYAYRPEIAYCRQLSNAPQFCWPRHQ